MLRVLACALFLPSLYAGLIRGVILDNLTGKPLARALVRLEPIPGSTGKALQTRAGRSGQFDFQPVKEGVYLLFAQRTGYFPIHHGQRRPTGQGAPLHVVNETDLFTELRMSRIGAITGLVADENGIGISNVPLAAYSARLPLRIVGRGLSDDRGVYRIAGLLPGRYWVRTGAYTLEDGSSIQPTFAPSSIDTSNARAYDVRLDQETADANVSPEFGPLYSLTVPVSCDRDGSAVKLVLSSELGRQTVQTGCGQQHVFEGLAPGFYEIFGEYTDGTGSGFNERPVRSSTIMDVKLGPSPQVDFDVQDAGTRGPARFPVVVYGRRDDLSGLDQPRQIALPRTVLQAGYWEMGGKAGDGQYIESITNQMYRVARPYRAERPQDAHSLFVDTRRTLLVTVKVSSKAAKVHGSVFANGSTQPGTLVYLWPTSDENRRILGGSLRVLSDVEGKYEFAGLPPGSYRVLATSDVGEVTPEVLDEARAPEVILGPSETKTLQIERWLAP